jgi:hypothetical protein
MRPVLKLGELDFTDTVRDGETTSDVVQDCSISMKVRAYFVVHQAPQAHLLSSNTFFPRLIYTFF